MDQSFLQKENLNGFTSSGVGEKSIKHWTVDDDKEFSSISKIDCLMFSFSNFRDRRIMPCWKIFSEVIQN